MDQSRVPIKPPEPLWGNFLIKMPLPDESPFSVEYLTAHLLKGAASFSYSDPRGRSPLQRRIATAAILKAWAQPRHIQIAGLFHTCYLPGRLLGKSPLDLRKQHGLQKLIGTKAERLVYIFGAISREGFFQAVRKGFNEPGNALPLETVTREGNSSLLLNRDEASGLCALFASTLAEELSDALDAPAVWLSDLSHICSKVPFEPASRLPIFDYCHATIALEAEVEVGRLYRAALGFIGSDNEHALTILTVCSTKVPWVAEPFLWQAYLERLRGADCRSRELANRSRSLFSSWGTSWDKRLPYREWLWVAERLAEGDTAAQVRRVLARVASASCTVPDASAEDSALAGPQLRLMKYFRDFQIRNHDLFMARYPDVAMQAEFDPAEFPIVSALEKAFQSIKEEIHDLEASLFFSEAEPIERTGKWEVLFFYERGRRNVMNCARCPTISGILDDYDPMRTLVGSIYASKLHPNTHVRNHFGPTNVRLRCHLGIQVPDSDCGLLCGGQILRWKAGKCIVFNDALEHEAWNRTETERVVLIVDLWHPDLTWSERETLRGLHNYALASSRNLQQYWESNEKSAYEKRVGYD